MVPKTEDDFMKFQNFLLQNFEVVQNGIKSFVENNTKLLNFYLEDMSKEEFKYMIAFKDYISELFGMLVRTTDFIKDMMTIRIQNTRCITSNVPKLNDHKIDKRSTISDSTVTEQKADYNFATAHTDQEREDSSSPIQRKEPSTPNLPSGKVDISVFQSGSDIPKAHVVSTDLEKLCFYICIPNSRDFEILSNLFNSRDRKPFTCPPVAGIVFGMKVDDGVVRTICCHPVSSGKVFLLDFGDIMNINKCLTNIFHLTKEEQNIPAQAILCKLDVNGANKNDIDYQRNCLKELSYQHGSFRVINKIDGILYLKLLLISDQNKKEEQYSDSNYSSSPPSSSDVEESNAKNFKTLTPEEMEMLNEESPCTSNALIAILGHDPKDDQRICRFYDPKTDTCFKGNNCKQQHIPLRKDYITKDIILANVYSDIPMGSIQYEPDQVVRVTVTHIMNLQYFYGLVLNSSNPVKPFIWIDREIPASDYLKELPYSFDIVLAKFSDGFWYRAKVLEADEYQRNAKVLYIDYGNIQTVMLENLATCSDNDAKLPAQAQQFRLANVQLIPEEKEAQIRGMDILRNMILNNDVNVIVEHHYEDLFVRFLDEPYSEIPQLLVNLHCVQLQN